MRASRMQHVEQAYRAGVAEAARDIAGGRPRLLYGARGEWGDDLARTLAARFGIELVVLSCLTDQFCPRSTPDTTAPSKPIATALTG